MNPTFGLSSINALTQALLVRQGLPTGEVEALLKVVGQELAVRYLGQGPEGAQLELPGGRILTAQGDVPFPEGTRLLVRVDNEKGVLKLHTLEAKSPVPPSLLAPLLQGEAASLSAQLQQSAPLLDLEPLVQLLKVMAGADPAANSMSPQGLADAIARLPKDLFAALARMMGAEAEDSPAALAQKIFASVSSGSGDAVLGLLQRAHLPPAEQGALDAWLRGVLGLKAETPHANTLSTTQGSRILSGAELAKVAASLNKTSLSPAQVPEAWEAWVKGTVRTLADPELSPRGAPFHAVQAKENTAFFEIPLPWAGGKPLQLWVEKDAPEEPAPGQEPATRVLMGLTFTRLGETRVGLQRSGSTLAVRVWTEHPELLEGQKTEIEQELREIASTVDLRVLPLGPGPVPEVRALVGGSSLHALG